MAYGPGAPISAKIVSSTNNIPTAFSTAAGSLALSGLSTYATNYKNLMVLNETAGRLLVSTTNSVSDAVPSSSSTQTVYVPASGTYTFSNVLILDKVYIQSDTGSAISTGNVQIQVW